MDPITYHRAVPADAQLLAEYRIKFALELSGEQSAEKIEDLRRQMTDYFTRATADSQCISFIARCDGEIAGIGSVHFREMPGNFKNPSGKWGYIMNMYTVPEFRRRGICKNILHELIEAATELGYSSFELHATKAGEGVYQDSGFEIHNERTYRRFINK